MPENESPTMRLLNAHGPYEHGIWKSGEISIEGVSSQAGTLLFFRRSFDLVEKISDKLLEIFSYDELKGKTILDIGCYDGWILHQLNQKFKFNQAVGVEPRKKNIQKGIYARSHYGIDTKIEIFEGSINSLESIFPGISFDIVLCLGTLHHVESTPEAVRNIARKTSDVLILDSMVIEKPKKDEKNILNLLNLKDIVYLGSNQEWATAAYKFESPYFDGSSVEAQIVNVPEERLIRMSLFPLGFNIIETSAPEKTFYTKKYQKLRGVKESFIFARKIIVNDLDRNIWKTKAKMYEAIFTFGLLEISTLKRWVNLLDMRDLLTGVSSKKIPRNQLIRSKILFLYSQKPTNGLFRLMAFKLNTPKETREILATISRAPRDKVLLEIAKHGIVNQEFGASIEILEKILDAEGADWRSFYRATYLLSIIYSITNNQPLRTLYNELLLISNSEWPLTNEEGMAWALGKN